MYSIILPITKYIKLFDKKKSSNKEHNNFTRFFGITWYFYLRNFNWKDVDTIYFVIPGVYEEEFKSMFDKVEKPRVETRFVIMKEEDILGIEGETIGNTRKQMMIKLLISYYISTKTYLTLDDDIMPLNRFEEKDFYISNKLGLQSNSHLAHEAWWRGSYHMLGLEYNPKRLERLASEGLLMDVTPEMLHTKSVRSLCDYIKSKWGNKYIEEFVLKNVEHRWSEYTLYWIYISEIKKNMRRLYIGKSNIPLNNAIWDISSDKKILENYIKNNLCKDRKSLFATIPSNIQRNRVSLIMKYLEND